MSESILFDTVFYMCAALCNYKCSFCSSHLHSLPDDDKGLNPTLFERVISRGRVICVSAYTGEMLLMPWFPEMVKILARHDKPFSLTTNGSLLSEKNVEMLGTSTINMLSVSINSLDGDTYERLSGGAKLSVVLDNVERLFESAPQYAIQFTFVINAKNIGQLKSFVDYGRDHRSHVAFYPLTPVTTEYDPSLILPASRDNVGFLMEAEQYAVDQGVSLASFTLEHNNASTVNTLTAEYLSERIRGCFVPFSQLYVASSGYVSQCCWGEYGRVMGDLNRESIDELWNNDNFTDLRQCVRNGDTRHCTLCRLWG